MDQWPWRAAIAVYILLTGLAYLSGFNDMAESAYNALALRHGGLSSVQCVSWFERLAIEWHVELLPAALTLGLLGVGREKASRNISIRPASALAGSFAIFWLVQLTAAKLFPFGAWACDGGFQTRTLWLCIVAAAACSTVALAKPGRRILGNSKAALILSLGCAAAGFALWNSDFQWHWFGQMSHHLFEYKTYQMAECASVAASMALGLAVGLVRGRLAGERGAARAISTACLLGFLSCIFFLAVPLSGISHDSMDIVLTHAWLWPLFLLLA